MRNAVHFASVRVVFGLVWFTLVGNLTSVDGSLRPHAVHAVCNEFQCTHCTAEL